MSVHIINPLLDSRWDEFVAWHPQASAFHQRGWLEALSRTYGYQPLALTSTAPGKPLTNAVVFCRVSSWVTGTRLVSLPFADHCQPLVDDSIQLVDFSSWLCQKCDAQHWRYVEVRPLSNIEVSDHLWRPGRSYYFHDLDIARSLSQILLSFHKDSIQRKIQRAEREKLSYHSGQSDDLLREFYQLLLITRRRHNLCPQPRLWFKNLVDCMGHDVQIRVVRKDRTPIAAILTLSHRSSVIYKYGCSDARFHRCGGMPLLFWRLIEESKARNAEIIDLGRSDLDNPGLVVFKDRFGAAKRRITYYRYPQPESENTFVRSDLRALRPVLAIIPDAILSMAGRVLYRHIG